jgi:hypothetical protein
MPDNELYLVVVPLIHLGTGLAEQTLTLLPGRDFATEFFPDEVEGYVVMFKNRAKFFTGGHVKGYEVIAEPIENGRVIVRVVQNVDD